MTNRRCFAARCVAFALAGLVPLPMPAAELAARPPNIVFILADDLGYGELGCYGQQRFATPHLDRLAAQGIRFTRHYAGSSVCAPSRATLFTGLHTGHVSLRNNPEFFLGAKLTPSVPYGLRAADPSVARTLQTAGYATGLIGKWGMGEIGSPGSPQGQGFDEFYGYVDHLSAHNHYPEFLTRGTAREPLPANAAGAQGAYAEELFTTEGGKFIRAHANRPFFLFMAYTAPHVKLECPPAWIAAALAAHPALAEAAPGDLLIAAMIIGLDCQVGQLLATLDELGLAENTLVVFTSDNRPHVEGAKTGTARSIEWDRAAGDLRGFKRDLFEGGLRVPTVARWPGHIAPRRVSAHVSAFWDWLPTLAAAAGVPVPTGLDGLSFLPELLGQPQSAHDYLYWELMVPRKGGQQALLQNDWKAIRLHADQPIQLYHLATDPAEQHDLAASEPQRVGKFAALFDSARIPSTEYSLLTWKGKKD